MCVCVKYGSEWKRVELPRVLFRAVVRRIKLKRKKHFTREIGRRRPPATYDCSRWTFLRCFFFFNIKILQSHTACACSGCCTIILFYFFLRLQFRFSSLFFTFKRDVPGFSSIQAHAASRKRNSQIQMYFIPIPNFPLFIITKPKNNHYFRNTKVKNSDKYRRYFHSNLTSIAL